MTFVIIHGSFGSPKENWIPELTSTLQALGQEVFAPQFPVDDFGTLKEDDITKQSLNNWLSYFEENILPKLKGKELCFVGHSIASVFILHLVSHFNLQLDSAIFVSPFLVVEKGRWQPMKVNESFYSKSFDWPKIKSLIPISYAVISDNDPYIAWDILNEFADRTDSQKIIVKNGEHLGSNINKFSLVEELCKARIKNE